MLIQAVMAGSTVTATSSGNVLTQCTAVVSTSCPAGNSTRLPLLQQLAGQALSTQIVALQ